MPIRFDITQIAVTIYCSCGWRELTLDREAARRVAVEHEANVHPESRQVRTAARIRETRRQQRSARDVRIAEEDVDHDG